MRTEPNIGDAARSGILSITRRALRLNDYQEGDYRTV
jgi:hypothetical protein